MSVISSAGIVTGWPLQMSDVGVSPLPMLMMQDSPSHSESKFSVTVSVLMLFYTSSGLSTLTTRSTTVMVCRNGNSSPGSALVGVTGWLTGLKSLTVFLLSL